MPIVLLSSPKGGVGKSSLARNLLVLATKAGRSVVGVDLDKQRTLTTWTQRRERSRVAYPALSSVPVISADLADYRQALRDARRSGAEVVVIDSPPSIEIDVDAMLSVSAAADLILVPLQQTQDDYDSAAPWMRQLMGAKARAAFVLNRANRRAKSFELVQSRLLAVGPLCPVVIPALEEIPMAGGKGLGVMDLSRPNSGETFGALWQYVAREVAL